MNPLTPQPSSGNPQKTVGECESFTVDSGKQRSSVENLMTDEHDSDELLGFLDWVEHVFRRMTTGLIRFLFITIPQWFKHIFRDAIEFLKRTWKYLEKILYKGVRVLFFGAIWASIAFGPLVIACVLQYPFLLKIALLWVLIAIVGTIIGYVRVRDHTIQECKGVFMNPDSTPQQLVKAVVSLVSLGKNGRALLYEMLCVDAQHSRYQDILVTVLQAFSKLGTNAKLAIPKIQELALTNNAVVKDAALNCRGAIKQGRFVALKAGRMRGAHCEPAQRCELLGAGTQDTALLESNRSGAAVQG